VYFKSPLTKLYKDPVLFLFHYDEKGKYIRATLNNDQHIPKMDMAPDEPEAEVIATKIPDKNMAPDVPRPGVTAPKDQWSPARERNWDGASSWVQACRVTDLKFGTTTLAECLKEPERRLTDLPTRIKDWKRPQELDDKSARCSVLEQLRTRKKTLLDTDLDKAGYRQVYGSSQVRARRAMCTYLSISNRKCLAHSSTSIDYGTRLYHHRLRLFGTSFCADQSTIRCQAEPS
jgi:hypothetical protein